VKCKYLEHQVMVRPDGEFRMCCISKEETNKENIKDMTPEQWLASATPTKAREQLAKGEWPDACKKCELMEEAGKPSMRQRPREYGPGISHLDIRFGNQCNLRCTMCYPGSSSSLYHEHQELKAKGESPWGWFDYGLYNWYTDEQGETLSRNPNLREVYLTGGEPMMVKGLNKFLGKLDPSVEVRFNTNGTLFNPQVFDELKRFNTVNMNFSIDGIGKVNDYIRWGSDWDTVEYNLNKFREVADVSLGPTVQIMNVLEHDTYIEYAQANDLEIFDNLLMTPDSLHIKNAPQAMKDNIKHFDYWMAQPTSLEKQDEFRKWIGVLDKHRGVSIKDYLPEVAGYYGIN